VGVVPPAARDIQVQQLASTRIGRLNIIRIMIFLSLIFNRIERVGHYFATSPIS
jgi:hypothetical protein